MLIFYLLILGENLDRQVKFNDPIKGLEKDEELEDYGANSRDNYYDQRPSKNRDINPLIEGTFRI